MTTEKENKFIDKIDCNFPYLDKAQSLKLIDEASNLSSNAIFTVIEELCRIPYSDRSTVSNELLLSLLTETLTRFDHPLKQMIAETARKMIIEEDLTVDEAIANMKIVEKFPGQYAALSIIYSSCDDVDQKLEPVWDSILDEWHKKEK